MAVQVDEGGGRVLRNKIEALGVHVHTSRNTLEIVDGATGAAPHGVRRRHAPGDRHDRVLRRHPPARRTGAPVRAGASARAAASRSTTHCRTSDRDVYAIGECAAWNEPGLRPGRAGLRHGARGRHATSPAQDDAAFAGADMSTKLKLMGVDVASIGDAHGKTPAAARYQYIDERKQVYKKIVVSEDGKQLLGAVLVGDAAEYGTLLQMALNGIALPADPEFLILPSSDGKAKPGLGVDALPDAAQICSCNNVTKGADLRGGGRGRLHHRRAEGLHQGRHHLRRLRAAGHAGDEGRDEQARHGGQQPPVRALRRIRARSCTTWCASARSRPSATCWRKHGKGLGCDICKPVGGQHLRLVLERLRAQEGAGQPAGQQRLLPRQHPEGRHLLGGAAHAGRRGHARRPDRRRPGRQEVRPLHQDHRRPARRPVRRARRAAAARSGKS